MKNNRIIILSTIIFIIVSINPVIINDYVKSESKIKEVDQFINSKMDRNNPPAQGISIALVDQNGMFWNKGYGYEDVEQEIEADSESLCRISSITKPITATAIMMLVEEEKINLGDPIIKYIPEFSVKNDFNKQITVKHLLTHRSGLKDTVNIDAFYELGNNKSSYNIIVEALKKEELLFPPGEKFNYSNTGYALLEGIIENTSKKSYNKFIKEEIFEPLEMNNSYIGLDKKNIALLSEGYQSTGDKTVKQRPVRYKAAASLISNAEDLSKYIEFILNSGKTRHGKELLKEEHLQQMFSHQFSEDGYGLGWGINRYELLDPELHIEHTGTLKGGGFHSNIVAVPDKNLGVIVLSNTETFSHFSRNMIEGILKRLLRINE